MTLLCKIRLQWLHRPVHQSGSLLFQRDPPFSSKLDYLNSTCHRSTVHTVASSCSRPNLDIVSPCSLCGWSGKELGLLGRCFLTCFRVLNKMMKYIYPLVIFHSELEAIVTAMVHRNSWFTQLQHDDFPFKNGDFLHFAKREKSPGYFSRPDRSS